MGFWDWFRAPAPPPNESDRIWLSKTAKLAGLAAEVAVAPAPTLVLAQFPQSLQEVREALAGVGFPGEDLQGQVAPAAVLGPPRSGDRPAPLLALVSQLRPTDPPPDPASETSARILVAERHFLRALDDEVLRFADGLGRPLVTFFLSLDEPLMKAFSGPWVTDVLRRLGMKETDAIESNKILRQIRRAQARFERGTAGADSADSAEEWLARHGKA
jgi:hypothetical protein